MAWPVAQLGPEFLELRTPLDHPPCEAEITMSIDGRERRWPVQLPQGVQANVWKTSIVPTAEKNGATAA